MRSRASLWSNYAIQEGAQARGSCRIGAMRGKARKQEVVGEEGELRVSSHLEKVGGVVDIVGNHSGRRRVATGDEIELHLALAAVVSALVAVLEGAGQEGPEVEKARRLVGQLKEKSD